MHSQLRSCRKHSKSLADTKYWEILENPKSFPPQYLCLSVSFSTVRILIGNQHSASLSISLILSGKCICLYAVHLFSGSVGVLTASISASWFWYFTMAVLNFSFSAFSSSCSFLFSFSFLCTSVSVPWWPPRTFSLLFITSASLFTAWEKKKKKSCNIYFYRDLFMINTSLVNSTGKPAAICYMFQ